MVAMLCLLAACNTASDFAPNAYKALSAAGVTYDAIMKTAATAYQNKQITDEQKTAIVKYGDAFQGSYNLAVVALEEYVAAKNATGSTDTSKAISALMDVASRLSELQGYAAPILNLKGN